MTKEQFLTAMGDIDDKFIREITDAPAVLDKPQVVYLIREPVPFWKIAVSAAACIALMAVGVYGFLKMKPADITPPNESGSSYSESGESSGNSYISEEDAKFKTLDKLETKPPLIPIEGDRYSFHQKYDEINFAVFDIEYTNASEDKPVYITVCDATYSGLDFIVPVSETIKITGSGKYVARYTEQYPINSISYLHAETCGEMYGDGGYKELDGLLLNGTWLP